MKNLQRHSKIECAKHSSNGSCGGFINGKCEVYKNKDCFWVLMYNNIKHSKIKKESFIKTYIEPKKNIGKDYFNDF
ncbi:MAG: methylenetetrahydrofolate reductase C-terminal domain-containing protein [Endomicrobium sp.]|jgi:hypothetical protein|nr:methylenetetrahydrofolate reductase C-terminal domain-containing protein [Endomicrobium sp.]